MADLWRGRTYHLVSGTEADPDKRHLYIILTEPNENDTVLAASLTSTIETDKTCTLHTGDHRFITKESYVVYSRLDQINTRIFLAEEENRDEDMNEDILKKICNGLETSDFVEPRHLEFYKKFTKEK